MNGSVVVDGFISFIPNFNNGDNNLTYKEWKEPSTASTINLPPGAFFIARGEDNLPTMFIVDTDGNPSDVIETTKNWVNDQISSISISGQITAKNLKSNTLNASTTTGHGQIPYQSDEDTTSFSNNLKFSNGPPGSPSLICPNFQGNASSATILNNARTIGGVSFNGSTNISLPGVNATGNQNTTGKAAGVYYVQSSAPTGSSSSAPPDGTMWLDTSTSELKIYYGVVWNIITTLKYYYYEKH